MCVTPYITENAAGQPICVPCGHCVQCLKDFQNGWSFRLAQECKRTMLPIFVTLTYNDEHLPVYLDDEGREHSCVFKSEVQRFMKRFRRYYPDLTKDCRYFAVGEYGKKYNRSHYHLVLICPHIDTFFSYSFRVTLKKLHDAVKKAWTLDGSPLGFVKVEHCKDKQIRYVCKYMNKLDRRPHIAKPFRLMSKSIGLNFLSQKMVDYYLTSFDRTVINGKARINMPRYYRKKLDELSETNWMLKKAGLTYSELLPEPNYKDGSLRSMVALAQRDFCENYLTYYSAACRNIAHAARVEGYQVYEPTRFDVYKFMVQSNHDLQDAIRRNAEVLENVSIRNGLKHYTPIGDEICEYSSPPI